MSFSSDLCLTSPDSSHIVVKPLDFFGGEPLKLLGTKYLAFKALAHAVDLVPRPLTLSLLLSLLQRLTHLDACAKGHGSEGKWRWTTHYSLHTTPYLEPNQDPTVSLVMLVSDGGVYQPVHSEGSFGQVI